MSRLNWISDEDLENEVARLIEVGRTAIAKKQEEKEFNKNIIDPFSAIYTMVGFDLSYEEWFISETTRQAQKTLQNQIGSFHENILSKVEGWEIVGRNAIFDLYNEERQIIAEIKNKHNTVKKSDLVNLHSSLVDLVCNKNSIYRNHTAYYVVILPQKGQRHNEMFVTSNNETGRSTTSNELVRYIDGASFYELVTGEENAIFDLYNAVIDVIKGYDYDVDELSHVEQYLNKALNKK